MQVRCLPKGVMWRVSQCQAQVVLQGFNLPPRSAHAVTLLLLLVLIVIRKQNGVLSTPLAAA